MHTSIIAGVIAQVNQETGLNLSFDFLTGGGAIIATNPKGQRHAIICYNSLIHPIIRGVVKERRRGKGFNWLCNGQAGTGAIQVAHWDEDHRFKPTAQQAAAALEHIYGPNWKELQKKGLFARSAFPPNLTIEDVLQAQP